MTQAAPAVPRVFWAVFRAPAGSPAPLYVVSYGASPGGLPYHTAPTYAANETQAIALVPKDRCDLLPPSPNDPPNLVFLWREKQ